jgi:hypothetical protein
MTATTTTRGPGQPAARKVDDVRTIYLPERTYLRLERFAEVNAMPVAEVLREFMEAFVRGKVKASRKRSTRRVNLWISVNDYAAFTKARKAQGVTIAEAIEAAMGDDA